MPAPPASITAAAWLSTSIGSGVGAPPAATTSVGVASTTFWNSAADPVYQVFTTSVPHSAAARAAYITDSVLPLRSPHSSPLG